MKVAISGKMTAGKTTIRRYLERGYGFVGYAFSEPIKRLEKIHTQVHPASWDAELWNEVVKLMPDTIYKENLLQKRQELLAELRRIFSSNKQMHGEKNRKLLQEIGTAARKIEPELWLNYTLNKTATKDFVVIEDLRYVNEAEAVRKQGFQVWRLDIDPTVQAKRIESLYGDSSLSRRTHQSEIDLDDRFDLFEYIIDGNVPLEEMYESIDLIMEMNAIKPLAKEG